MANSPEETDEVTIALPRRMLVFLRSIASTTGEQLETMVAEAIRMYVRAQERKMEEIGKAVEEAARGEFISDEEVEAHLRDLLGEPSPERRAMLKRELGRQMSIISEGASCSTWAWCIEDELPQLLQQRPSPNSQFITRAWSSRRSMRTGWSRWQRSWGIGLCEGLGRSIFRMSQGRPHPTFPNRRERSSAACTPPAVMARCHDPLLAPGVLCRRGL